MVRNTVYLGTNALAEDENEGVFDILHYLGVLDFAPLKGEYSPLFF